MVRAHHQVMPIRERVELLIPMLRGLYRLGSRVAPRHAPGDIEHTLAALAMGTYRAGTGAVRRARDELEIQLKPEGVRMLAVEEWWQLVNWLRARPHFVQDHGEGEVWRMARSGIGGAGVHDLGYEHVVAAKLLMLAGAAPGRGELPYPRGKSRGFDYRRGAGRRR